MRKNVFPVSGNVVLLVFDATRVNVENVIDELEKAGYVCVVKNGRLLVYARNTYWDVVYVVRTVKKHSR